MDRALMEVIEKAAEARDKRLYAEAVAAGKVEKDRRDAWAKMLVDLADPLGPLAEYLPRFPPPHFVGSHDRWVAIAIYPLSVATRIVIYVGPTEEGWRLRGGNPIQPECFVGGKWREICKSGCPDVGTALLELHEAEQQVRQWLESCDPLVVDFDAWSNVGRFANERG